MRAGYFADSYAVVEALEGSPAYDPYLDAKISLTQLNLFKICYTLARKFGKRRAVTITEECEVFLVEIDSHTLIKAALLRWQMRERSVSMTDCIGYCMALRMGIPFLTGDRQFKGMPNVEFVA